MRFWKRKNDHVEFDGLYFNQVEAGKPGEDGYIRIVPVGTFPVHPNGAHEILPRHIEEMAANFNATKKDLLFDYEHDSLWGRSIAAGWSNAAEAREDGLYVKYPDFTPKAQEMIRNREFRYFSPVYRLNSLSKQGKEIGAQIHSVALTNIPYMDNEIDHIKNNNVGDDIMLEKILALLGLASNATEQEVAEKINSLKATPPAPEPPKAPEPPAAPEEKVNAEVLARLKALEDKDKASQETAAEQLINSAIADGKILPADKDVFLTSAKANFAATKEMLDKRAKNSAMPGTIKVPEKDPNAKPDVIKNAVDFIKAQGRAVAAKAQ